MGTTLGIGAVQRAAASGRGGPARSLVHSRSGIALLYLAVAMVPLIGICSLAVDFGRWQLCKTQMQRAADAAARAGAFRLIGDSTTAAAAATSVVDANVVDVKTVAANADVTVSVQLLLWTSATSSTVLTSSQYGMANAVRVTLTYDVPLTFGSVIGLSSKAATRTATARVNINTQAIYVGAQGDLWLAGEPTGTRASQPDPGYQGQGVNSYHPWQYDYAGPVGGTMASGEPYSSPTPATIGIVPGALMKITNVSGGAKFAPGTNNTGTADGVLNGSITIVHNATANGVAEHGIADVYLPLCAFNAVFLDGTAVPDSTAAPAALDFTTQAARDYRLLAPKPKQPFFVGNGQTSGGSQQWLIVPQRASAMYFGSMDDWEWDNNTNGFTATITEYWVETVQ